MIGKRPACMMCKKFKMIDESPWCICDEHPDYIPDKYIQVLQEDVNNLSCPYFEPICDKPSE